ncbi:MAG: HAD family phosphatase [Ferruginibacter sp.]
MNQIRNIIFDLGGVLLNINYQKTAEAFEQLGFQQFNSMYTQYTADEVFGKLETGNISNKDFYNSLLAKAAQPISEKDVEIAWNAMLLDFRIESLAKLRQLKQDYQLFLLSNTNDIHYKAFQTIFTQSTGEATIDHYFHKAYYSHKVGLRKPNADNYQFVAADAGLKPTETLFIDDSYNNIAAAASLGFQTHLLLEGEKIETLPYW